MSDDQPRGRRLTAEARRAQIVAVATALIAQHGFHNVTIQQIADACGIVKTAVIRHFPTKPDILVAVLETRDAEGLSFGIRSPADAVDGLCEEALGI